jgi:DNA-binding CsgD family transcriptional regulator
MTSIADHATIDSPQDPAIDRPVGAHLKELWDWVRRGLADGPQVSELSLANGDSVVARVEPVHDGAEVVGALIRLDPSRHHDPVAEHARPPRDHDRETLAWATLTDTERKVAEVIAQGLTNAEAAARLFMSPHTVDTHLRHIYQKLDINSRVQLAGLAAHHPRTS